MHELSGQLSTSHYIPRTFFFNLSKLRLFLYSNSSHLCHHSPCLQWGWLSRSFLCTLALALILPENKILKKFRNYFHLKKLPGKYSISLNTCVTVHMSARLPLYILILGHPGHWDVDVLSSSPWEILVHHGIAGWNTTSLSLKKNGFVIPNIRIDRSGCQTGEHVVCHCLPLYISFLSSSLGTAYHISQSLPLKVQ